MRLFTAVEIDAALASAVGDLIADLRRRVEERAPRARLTWIPPARLHFTVQFIGDVDDARAAAIVTALGAPIPVPPFDVTLEKVGIFPRSGPPRVLWVGVAGDGADMMAAVAQEVGARLAPCGVEREARSYRPHLTLARVRDAAGLGRDLVIDAPQGPFGTSHVDAITLFQSRLSPKGPTYIPAQRTALGAGHPPPAPSPRS